MLAKRVIPCLDVHDGQVTRGVQFGKAEAGELRNVGDPVELALEYNRQGADEMVFFDITASAHERKTIVDVIERAALALIECWEKTKPKAYPLSSLSGISSTPVRWPPC